MSKARHPIQPLELDEHCTLRFKGNAIVRFLLDKGPHDLNDVARGNFSREDREQFAQLIGYSLSGASELSYVSSEVLTAAELTYRTGESECAARSEYLRAMLEAARTELAPGVAKLFGIHEDDLKSGSTP